LLSRALVQVSLDGGVLFMPLLGGASVAELGGPPLALPPTATHVRLNAVPARDDATLDDIQRDLDKVGFFANGATRLPVGYARDEQGTSRDGARGTDLGSETVARTGATTTASAGMTPTPALPSGAPILLSVGATGRDNIADGRARNDEGGRAGAGSGGGDSRAAAAGLGADAAADTSAFEHLVTPLWDRYRARAMAVPSGRGVPKLPRRLTMDAVMEVIEEVLSARWEQMNQPEPHSEPDTLDEFFYQWLDSVYVLQETVVLVAFSVLAALEEFWMVSSTAAMFMKCLEGELDGATWQYTMHFRRLLTTHPMTSTSDFAAFAALLYPQAREDELMVLTSAFSVAVTDVPNAAQVVDFLTGRLLAKDELRLKRLVKVLKYKDTHHRGAFSRSEWTEMCRKMFPHLTSDAAGSAFDRAAARMEGVERVPIEPLARLACVLDCAPLMPPALQEPAEPTLKRNMLK
jgi:hypothetical protein